MSETQFNGLSPSEAERLALLAEECGEVIQAIGKILRHGYESTHPDGGPTNRQSLVRECGDVKCIISMLEECGDISREDVDERVQVKAITMFEFLHHH